MKPFRYERAVDAPSAVATLMREPGARFLAGGTNLVDLMRLEVETPELLVDVRRLDLGDIEQQPDGWLRIGAGVTNSDLAADPAVRARYPVVAEALLAGASGQLRNLATVGGNLLQRTRCRYFQDVTKPCNKREPGTGCPARDGEHRNLAILGHSPHCVATHPSDLAVALVAVGGVVHVERRGGPAVVPMGGLHRLPGDEPHRDTVLDHGDLITAIGLPPLPLARNSTYRKVRDRASFAFAVISVAAALEVEDGVVLDARIALGGVAHTPWRATVAEEVLRGARATPEVYAAAAAAELAAAEPLRDNAFKVRLAERTIARTLAELAEA